MWGAPFSLSFCTIWSRSTQVTRRCTTAQQAPISTSGRQPQRLQSIHGLGETGFGSAALLELLPELLEAPSLVDRKQAEDIGQAVIGEASSALWAAGRRLVDEG